MTDLHIGPDRASPVEQAAVDAVVARAGPVAAHEGDRLVRSGRTRARERRHLLLPALHALQRAAGWISPGGLNHVAEMLEIPPADAFGVASFYALLRTEPPDHDGDTVHVCVDPACRLAGAADLLETERAAAAEAGVAVHESPCLGQCERAPATYVQGRDRPDRVPADDAPPVPLPQAGDARLRLLRRVDRIDPTSLDSYVAAGGYRALARAVGLGPAGIIAEVEAAGLKGRGGAAFPTATKWAAVAAGAPRHRHVVANCDESEPGTFKDRILLERDPFALVEAMTIAALATGAESGWIYIRGEYPLATERLLSALAQARGAGFLGENAAGIGQRFDIELRRGAGAYICGEETALFNSIEGHRGEPRNKPPFPTTHGLFGEPTAVNNPETLANVLDIVVDGGQSFAARGTPDSTGTRLFCLSGHVGRPGLYEAELGITLGALVDLAGGVAGSGRMAAVLLGGAAGSFVGPDALDLRLTFEDTRAAGVSLGSGVVTVFDDTTDFVDIVERIATFFRDESCGQCVPCRVGAVRQLEVLQRTGRSPLSAADATLIDDMGRAMRDASICGLGHTASVAVQSAIGLGLVGAQ